MSESIGKLSGRSTPPLHPDEPMSLPDENEANFITFTVKIPKENLSLSTVRQSFQSGMSSCRELNQFKVSVEQKVIIPNTEWQPTCQEMILEDLKIGGNCLFEALHDSEIDQKVVFHLRTDIALAQKDAFENVCMAEGIQSVINSAVNKKMADIVTTIHSIMQNGVVVKNTSSDPGETFGADLFQGMVSGNANINMAAEYVLRQSIPSSKDISNEQLGEILKLLGVSTQNDFLTTTLNSGEVFIQKGQDRENTIRSLCNALMELNKLKQQQLPFVGQGALNSNLLLNVIQHLYNNNKIPISSSENVTGFLSNANSENNRNHHVTKEICQLYNDNASEEEKMVLDEQGLPSRLIIGQVISLALSTVITGTQNKYVDENVLQYVVNKLERPILLLNTDGTEERDRLVTRPGNIVSGSVLYAPTCLVERYSTERLNSLALSGAIVIALKPGHFIAEAKFSEENNALYVVVGSEKKRIRSFADLQNAFNAVRQPEISSIPDPGRSLSISGSSRRGLPSVYSEILSAEGAPLELASGGNLSGIAESILALFPAQEREPFSSLRSELARFETQFIPYLNNVGKDWKVEAEIRNLQHIASCSTYMLNSMHFKPEFVAKIVCERLRMAMFGSGKFDDTSEDVNMGSINVGIPEEEDRYQPSCMWDFGEERTTIPLEGEDYHWGGVLASPPPQSQEEQLLADQQRNTKNRFGVLRGCDKRGDCYVMPNGELTPSLGARFRQFLAFQSGVDNIADGIQELLGQILNDFASDQSAEQILEQIRQWKTSVESKEVDRNDVQRLLNIIGDHALSPLIQKNIAALSWASLNESTPLTKLPPSLMFLVGLQFGQNQVGSWNPFTLAAKKYMAGQFTGGLDGFFWLERHQPPEDIEDVLQYSFADLIAKIWPGREFNVTLAGQFEDAVLAYYAITQEILSRSNFQGNDGENHQIETIFRLEDFYALTNMGAIEQDDQNYTAKNTIEANSIRPSIVSASLGAHVVSLDRPSILPLPIKAGTKYVNVHHARIFGCHWLNVDFISARRVIDCNVFKKDDGESAESKVDIGTYVGGCPYFRDKQREVLLIPHRLQAEITDILAFAEDDENSFVLCSDAKEATGHNVIPYTLEKLKHSGKSKTSMIQKRFNQIKFCMTKDASHVDTVLSDRKNNIAQLRLSMDVCKEAHVDLQKRIVAVKAGLKFDSLVKLKQSSKKKK